MFDFVVAAGVADIRREPDPASELVTQALMNVPARAGEIAGDWTYVMLSDYEGWMRSDQLEYPISKGFCKICDTCGTPLDLVAVVSSPYAELYADAQGDETLGRVYLSTVLPLLDITHLERLQVALPGESSAWLDRRHIAVRFHTEAFSREPVRVVTEYARSFLGVPYLWGGTTCEGIDCSGFVQLCYRMGGYILPRDAHQQHDFLTHPVQREQMREGDLIFFGQHAITHVALALNATEYIHSEGQHYGRVLINSFDKNDPRYYPRLDEIVWGIKRVICEE
ncbi:MAG TPA: C40 family peptidase [Ktedonobacteraceae bacterium]|jgi:hypothetical protein|nr:C40 family peptidase [Ktedonobacteraceae bacterium]